MGTFYGSPRGMNLGSSLAEPLYSVTRDGRGHKTLITKAQYYIVNKYFYPAKIESWSDYQLSLLIIIKIQYLQFINFRKSEL